MVKYIAGDKKVGIYLKRKIENREEYTSYIEQKRPYYEMLARMIGYIVKRMQEEGRILGKVKITGRLKSFKSASENESKKAIDDCFGIRIIAESEVDLDRIEAEIAKLLDVKKTKNHKKDTRTPYDGIHQMVGIPQKYADINNLNSSDFPIIEVQYWTEALERKCVSGELAYSKYKSKDLIKIAEIYKSNPKIVFENLPICYEILGNSIKRLSDEEALFKTYPELKDIILDSVER